MEICLGYTKFYAVQKKITRRLHSMWTAKLKEGKSVFWLFTLKEENEQVNCNFVF